MSFLPPYPDQSAVQDIASLRQHLHKMPELSWLEFQTTAFLCQQMEELGYDIRWGKELYETRLPHNLPPAADVQAAYARAEQTLGADNPYLADMKGGHTGLVATLKGGEDGPTYGFRFDIDALPIQESCQTCHGPASLGFVSQHHGAMHACGHDAHMAIGLGLAKQLADHKAQMKGTVHFFFQPAEEVAGGGIVFAQLPELKEVDKFFTLHIGIINERKIVCDATWIAAQIFDVEIKGRASHAGNRPHEGQNALLAACQAVQGLYALPRHSAGMSRVNVGQFVSENANNVIADDVRFRFEVRGAQDEVCNHMAERAGQVINGAAAMNGCDARIHPVTRFASQPNSPDLIREIEEQAKTIGIPDGALRHPYQVPASEDASFMIRTVQDHGGQATHMVLGCPVQGGHHHERFDIDEDVLSWGCKLLGSMILDKG